MNLKIQISAAALMVFAASSCRNATFENVDDKAKDKLASANQSSANQEPDGSNPPIIAQPINDGEDSDPSADSNGGAQNGSDPGSGKGGSKNPIKQTLTVTLPSPEIKPGEEKIQASAALSDDFDPPAVIWTISGPQGKADIGSIDQNGVYTSPKDNDREFPVTIIATLISDPSITGAAVLTILPKEQIFARCTRGNETFPILANVFQINRTATRLPNFNNASEAKKVTTVCMDKYAVAPRDFESGFPDVPDLFEFFALQTTTTMIFPVDGDYVLQLNSDDGSKLSLDGLLIIDNDGQHQAQGDDPADSPNSGRIEKTITITKGEHALSLDYFQGPKIRIALELKWKVPGSNRFVYVPTEAFK